MSRHRQQLVVSAVLCAALCPAYANDGGIAFGGSPGLLAGHPSVRMEREVIQMKVRGLTVKTTADFDFVNSGPACRVRMGFPDQGEGANNPDEEGGPHVLKSPPQTTFTSFSSSIDGKRVPTRLIRSDRPGQYWHAKTVNFPAHGHVHVQDIYTQPVSGAIAEKGNYQSIAYIVHTGSSWQGKIGSSILTVDFPPLKKHLIREARPAVHVREMDWTRVRPGIVYYSGFGTPTVSGQRLRFERKNWRPTAADDLTLYFKG